MPEKRALKFRAWDKGHNKMVYKVNLYSINATGEMNKAQLDNKQIMNVIGFDCEVMQFTGLHDRNGKEIFESDIVTYEIANLTKGFAPFYRTQRGEVKFEDGYFYPRDMGIDNNTHVKVIEVIGNVWEHPELLHEAKPGKSKKSKKKVNA